MRVCLFTPTFLPLIGGAERDADTIARGLTDRGHTVSVLARDTGDPEPDLPYPVIRYQRPPKQHWWPGLLTRPLNKLHAQNPFDVILTTYAYPTGFAALKARRVLGTPVVACPQGADLYPNYHELTKPGVKDKITQTYRSCDRLIAISGWVRDRLHELAGPDLPPIDLIPNGIDLEAHDAAIARARQLPSPVNGRFVLHLGRVIPTKCVEIAVEAVARRAELFRTQGWKYAIVGDGSALIGLKQKIADARLGDIILTPGLKTGLERDRYLAHAAILVSSSRNEGHPNVLVEAMATGLPVLVSDIAPHREMLTHAPWGMLFREGQSDDLAQTLERAMQTDLHAMQAAAHHARDRFDITAMISGYIQALQLAITPQNRAS